MDVVQKLFDNARAAALGQAHLSDITPQDVAELLADPFMQVRLRQEFARLNDPEVRDLIVAYLRVMTNRLEDEAAQAEDAIESMEWSFGFGSKLLPVIGGGALIAAIIASGGVLGAAIASIAGVASLVGASIVRYRLKAALRRSKSDAERMKRLIAEVEK